MNRIIFIICLFILTFSGNVFAGDYKKCSELALSKNDMNQCAADRLKQAESALQQVYAKIQEIYKEERIFLEKLEYAQKNWEKLRDADYELKFPHLEEPNFYGTVYSMCSAEYKTQLTLQRMDFLKQWLKGSEPGDLCRGSQLPDSYLQGLLPEKETR